MVHDPTLPIREAVASGEFERALVLWGDCAARLQEELRDGSFNEARLMEARDLVESTRLETLCARAHAQDQLNLIHSAQQYVHANESAPALFRMNA